MPIGNGRLHAAIVDGGGDKIISINEDTIWSGPIQDRTPNGLAETDYCYPAKQDLQAEVSKSDNGNHGLADWAAN